MDAAQVKDSVQLFREKTAYGASTEHCFTPWYLHHHHELPITDAVSQSSDGNYDFGLDGFHIEEEPKPRLFLIQSKFSSSKALLEEGYVDLQRALPEVKKILDGVATDAHTQNHVLIQLRSRLNRLSPPKKKKLSLEFQILHMNETEPAILKERLRHVHERLQEAIEDVLDGYSFKIRPVGPSDLDPVPPVVPPEMNTIRFTEVQSFVAGKDARVFTGIGRLSDLVELFAVRRDHLFAKNVRFFLHSRKNTEKGPAGKMRETLKDMCVAGKTEPERFALFHNGITICASKTEVAAGGLSVREPYVLNGCQTIKNAYFFLNDSYLKKKIDLERWSRIAIPIRVVETKDDELVRTITINNNRQNQMSVAALRANDPIQLRLQERFRERKIFYQRQEGALSAMEADRPELLETDYENSGGTCVEIQELARAIAAASGDLYHAEHPADLFESDAAYSKVFNERNLRSLALLTLLQNLYRVLPVVLKKELALEPASKGPTPARLRFHAICLVARALSRDNDISTVQKYGAQPVDRDQALREFLAKLMRSPKTGIRSAFAKTFMQLATSDQASINNAFNESVMATGLKASFDAFTTFADVEANVDNSYESDE